MKLRNKKTGIMGELHYEPDKEYHFTVATEDPADMTIHKTLAQLNEVWEDYKPTESLIKDEKIRELVRAWAQINKLEEVEVRPPEEDCAIMSFTDAYWILGIDFFLGRSDISGGTYTIAELCGEEE